MTILIEKHAGYRQIVLNRPDRLRRRHTVAERVPAPTP